MSSTSNAQDLLVNVFRPTYTYDSNTGFTPALVVSNVSELIVGRINTDRLAVADSNGNSYVGCNAGPALANLTTYSNIAIGVSAMAGASNSSNNVSVGISNFSGLSNANSNVGLGANTLMTGAGQKNILIGANVVLASGSGNIVIGNDLSLGTISNTLRLGNLLYGNLTTGFIGINNPVPAAALDISGEVLFRNKVGVQKTNPIYTLDVAGSIYATEQIIGGKGTQTNPMYTFIDSSGSGMYVPVDPSYGTGSFGIAVNRKAAAIFSSNAVNFFQNLDVSGTFSARNVDLSAFSVTDGTESRPSVKFINDASTGLYLVSSNRLGVTTGGVRRMEVLSNGDVSMGKLAVRDISFTGTIIGSNANTCNVIGGVVLCNGYVTTTGTSSSSNLVVTGFLRNSDPATQLDISGGNISNSLTTRSSNFRASAGTATIPTYSFTSDPSTGLHSVGTSQLAFDTSGIQRMVISNENVGIGTTTPANALDVSGTIRVIGAASNLTLSNGRTFSRLVPDTAAVAVGWGTNSIAFSTDGITWSSAALTGFSTGRGVAWNGSLWVALGSGTLHTIATSTDGTTWVGRGNDVFTTTGRSAAWNGSLWVAVGGGTNTIATSTDGITWTGRGASIFTTEGRGVAWNGSLWVAVGSGENSIATSPDGINWTGRGNTILTVGYAVAWNGRIWVAGGGSSSPNTLATSTDGINWTGLGTSIFTSGVAGVAWNGSLWVAVGTGGNLFATSPDGITWTGRGSPSFFSTVAYGIAWNGTQWIAVGNRGTASIATSTDGITWTQRSAVFTTAGEGVATRLTVLPFISTTTLDASGGNVGYTGSLVGSNAGTSNSIGGVTLRNSTVFAGSGTAANPAYSFTGDPSTGLHSAGASQLAFDTSGIQRMVISNSNVGIGTTTPGFTLDVSGTTESTIFVASNGTATIPSYSFTSDPSTGLHSAGASQLAFDTAGIQRMVLSNSVLALGRTPVADTSLIFQTPSNAYISTGRVYLGDAPNSTPAYGATIIEGLSNGGSGACDLLLYSRAPGSGAGTDPVERMRILGANGNVGIGTRAPNAVLDVSGTIRTGCVVGNELTTNTGSIEIGGGVNGDGVGGLPAFAFQGRDGASGRGYRHFVQTVHSGGVSTTANAIRFYICSGGAANASTAPGTGNKAVMAVTQLGVGIGTLGGANPLTVVPFSQFGWANRASTNPINYQVVIGDAGGGSPGLYLGAYYTGGQGAASTLQSSDSWNGTINPAPLLLNPVGGAVSIGTASPNTTLDVSGTFRVANGRALFDVTPQGASAEYAVTTTNGHFIQYRGGSTNKANSNVVTYLSPDIGAPSYFLSNNVGIGRTNPEHPLDVNGTARATTFMGNGTIPMYGIIMWAGLISEIPAGWTLCDGTNSAPDLRDRFILGAGSSYIVNQTGGASNVTLAISNIPAHTHTLTAMTEGNQGINGSAGGRLGNNNGVTTSSVGSGTAFSILPPYYALAYIMRIA